jgi:hypothetical protein
MVAVCLTVIAANFPNCRSQIFGNSLIRRHSYEITSFINLRGSMRGCAGQFRSRSVPKSANRSEQEGGFVLRDEGLLQERRVLLQGQGPCLLQGRLVLL